MAAANIGEALRAYLLDRAGVSAIVGTRMYPGAAPERAAFPRLVYQTVSTNDLTDHDGGDGYTDETVQIAAEAHTRATATALMHEVRKALVGYGAADGLMDGWGVAAILPEGRFEQPEAPADGSDQWTYRWVCDYRVTHYDAAPTPGG